MVIDETKSRSAVHDRAWRVSALAVLLTGCDSNIWNSDLIREFPDGGLVCRADDGGLGTSCADPLRNCAKEEQVCYAWSDEEFGG